MARYEAGETLASIARTYDCSPPAISYIVSRSRTRQPAAEAPAPASTVEPQLVKIHPGEAPAADGHPALGLAPPRPDPAAADPGPAPGVERHSDESPRNGNGFFRNGNGDRSPLAVGGMAPRPPMPPAPRPNPAPAPFNGEQRRTLHLSLGGNGGNGHGGAPEPAGNSGRNPFADRPGPAPQPPLQAAGQAAGDRLDTRPDSRPDSRWEPAPPHDGTPHEPARPGYAASAGGDRGAGNADAARRRDAGTFIDHELRARVDGDIAAFLAAFDAALADDNQESRAALREATDRLLRAGARTRIELERLEARVPLPTRDTGNRPAPNWRLR